MTSHQSSREIIVRPKDPVWSFSSSEQSSEQARVKLTRILNEREARANTRLQQTKEREEGISRLPEAERDHERKEVEKEREEWKWEQGMVEKWRRTWGLPARTDDATASSSSSTKSARSSQPSAVDDASKSGNGA